MIMILAESSIPFNVSHGSVHVCIVKHYDNLSAHTMYGELQKQVLPFLYTEPSVIELTISVLVVIHANRNRGQGTITSPRVIMHG